MVHSKNFPQLKPLPRFSVSMKRCRAFCLVILVPCLLLGCTVKVSYRFLDWIVAWSVDDYVSWDQAQQQLFDRRLEKLLAWHQADQLPRYAQLLQQLRQDMAQPVSRETLQLRLEQAGELYQQLLLKAEPDALILLSSLSEQQVLAMEENLAKATAKLEKKYLQASAEQRVERRVESAEDLTSSLLGRLDVEQEQLIQDWAEQVTGTDLWIENRKQWATLFIATLANRTAVPELDFATELHRLLVEPQTLWTTEYQQASEKNVNLALDLVLALQVTLTERQRQHLYDEIDQWVADLQDLSKR